MNSHNHNRAYLIEVFDEKRGHTDYLRRISLNYEAAESWVYDFAKKYKYEVEEINEGLCPKYNLFKDGEHILTGKVTNIALV